MNTVTKLKNQLKPAKPTPTNMVRAVLRDCEYWMSYDDIILAVHTRFKKILTRQQLYQLIARELKADHVDKQRVGMLVMIGWVGE